MNKPNCILIITIIFHFIACHNEPSKNLPEKGLVLSTTDLRVDHFNIWVENPQQARQRLIDIGFTSVPDSLSQIHAGQGTTGRYFNFLNSYLELIYIYDHIEFLENARLNEDMDFMERANWKINGASPFSLALRLSEYDIEKIPFECIIYHQAWMGENLNIYAAKNSKKQLKEPSIFVVYPEIESVIFDKLADLDTIPEAYAFVKAFYQHPNGAKKITKIIITSKGIDLTTETIEAVNEMENLMVQKGTEHLMELYFDDNIQGRSFDLRPEMPLKIYL